DANAVAFRRTIAHFRLKFGCPRRSPGWIGACASCASAISAIAESTLLMGGPDESRKPLTAPWLCYARASRGPLALARVPDASIFARVRKTETQMAQSGVEDIRRAIRAEAPGPLGMVRRIAFLAVAVAGIGATGF